MTLKLTVETASESIAGYDFVIKAAETTIGRSSGCDVQLPFHAISGHHLTIIKEGETFMVCDVGSTNGTRLNGRHLDVDHFVPIGHGDTLILNDVVLSVMVVDDQTGLTSERTEDLVRSMAADYLQKSAPTDRVAYVEVLQGPNRGDRRDITLDQRELTLGAGRDADWRLDDPLLSARAITITYGGEHYSLNNLVEGETPMVDGYPVASATAVRLHGGSRIRVGGSTLLFVDELDSYLSNLDRLKSDAFAAVTDDAPPLHKAAAEQTQQVPRMQRSERLSDASTSGMSFTIPSVANVSHSTLAALSNKRAGWSPLDIVLIVTAVVLSVGALALLLVLFGAVSI